MTENLNLARTAVSPRRLLVPLALAQFICSFAGSNMNVMINDILTTLLFTDLQSRAWAFGRISGMGGVGAAAGPLIGGLITTAISWRASFLFQALIIAAIV